jgi:hypothetical protein
MARVRFIQNHAIDNLRFIRETMERSSAFTAVPGWAGFAMGLTALAAAWVASRQASRELWLATWLGEGMVAIALGSLGVIEKAARTGQSLNSAPARKFALSFAPPLAVGAVLSTALWRQGIVDLLAPVWILLYGTAIVTGGAFSVRAIPVMGLVFIAIGSVSLFLPAAWGNGMLALSFGLVHIVFGVIVALKHGG